MDEERAERHAEVAVTQARRATRPGERAPTPFGSPKDDGGAEPVVEASPEPQTMHTRPRSRPKLKVLWRGREEEQAQRLTAREEAAKKRAADRGQEVPVVTTLSDSSSSEQDVECY